MISNWPIPIGPFIATLVPGDEVVVTLEPDAETFTAVIYRVEGQTALLNMGTTVNEEKLIDIHKTGIHYEPGTYEISLEPGTEAWKEYVQELTESGLDAE